MARDCYREMKAGLILDDRLLRIGVAAARSRDDMFRINNFLGLFIRFSSSVGATAGEFRQDGQPEPIIALVWWAEGFVG
jgi:hypothetical protein